MLLPVWRPSLEEGTHHLNAALIAQTVIKRGEGSTGSPKSGGPPAAHRGTEKFEQWRRFNKVAAGNVNWRTWEPRWPLTCQSDKHSDNQSAVTLCSAIAKADEQVFPSVEVLTKGVSEG